MTELKPDVSIIIPTYNGEKYLDSISKTIEPYYKKGYEIIMVDDGSTISDNALLLFGERFPNAICKRQDNNGVASARDAGAKIASGEYLQFLDIDDSISSDKIELQYIRAKKENADLVYSDWRMVIYYDENDIQYNSVVHSGQQDDYISSLLEKWWNPPHSYIIKKAAYEKIGGGNQNLVNAQDFDVFIRLAINGCKFIYEPGLHSFYYRYVNRTSLARGPRNQYWKDTEIVVDNAIKLLQDKGNLKKEYKNAAALRLFLVARNVFKIDREWNDRIFKKVLSLNPDFVPKHESKKFKLLYSIVGYMNSEKILNSKFLNRKNS
ncbi:glycosyltransferase family 2 protein [Winogradskyella helgolandensis]|uniref:glycosyltransferase family 2 protein n=1 Tax=Winogradskyella helgolandensis TaxID=2697010 RepID=UPI0015BC61A9|nr:glycosyltransferase family A protein [Winogradskyella helgolandensis]